MDKNERFFKQNKEYSLVEILVVWFSLREEAKSEPNIVIDETKTTAELVGSTLYSPKEITLEELEVVKKILSGEHQLHQVIDNLYKKYNYDLDNSIEECTDKEFNALREAIDFEYSSVANVLLLFNRRMLRKSRLGLNVNISMSHNNYNLYKYKNLSEKPELISLEDFKLLLV